MCAEKEEAVREGGVWLRAQVEIGVTSLLQLLLGQLQPPKLLCA